MRAVSDCARVAIVGAGPQALTVAAYLVSAGVRSSELVVVDPAAEWMAVWRRRFAALGIEHLRSPSVHQPHPDPYALSSFAAAHRRTDELHHTYGLPSTTLFDDFCAQVVVDAGIDGVIRADAVVGLDDGHPDSVALVLASGGTVRAEHVVWATDPSVPCWPGPVGDRIVRWENAQDALLQTGGTIAVVGGGLTAAHLVQRALDRGSHVEWLTRRPIVERDFDTDPGWLGPKEMQGFAARPAPADRLELVLAARGGGSVPPWMMRRLARAERSGRLCRRTGDVRAASGTGHGGIVTLDGVPVHAKQVWLATGDRPDATASAPLRDILARCGTELVGGRPILDPALRIPGSRVHVVGRLAQLQLGPTAGNLAGARRAAELVVGAVVGHHAMYELSGT